MIDKIPLYDPELAARVTETGQKILRETIANFENLETIEGGVEPIDEENESKGLVIRASRDGKPVEFPYNSCFFHDHRSSIQEAVNNINNLLEEQNIPVHFIEIDDRSDTAVFVLEKHDWQAPKPESGA